MLPRCCACCPSLCLHVPLMCIPVTVCASQSSCITLNHHTPLYKMPPQCQRASPSRPASVLPPLLVPLPLISLCYTCFSHATCTLTSTTPPAHLSIIALCLLLSLPHVISHFFVSITQTHHPSFPSLAVTTCLACTTSLRASHPASVS